VVLAALLSTDLTIVDVMEKVNFKDFIKLLNARDDLRNGVSVDQVLRQLPDEQFKLAFWSLATAFKQMRKEAERRGLWDELTGKKNGISTKSL
jgi:hypothetical protein